jgi:hypothetical protein
MLREGFSSSEWYFLAIILRDVLKRLLLGFHVSGLVTEDWQRDEELPLG